MRAFSRRHGWPAAAAIVAAVLAAGGWQSAATGALDATRPITYFIADGAAGTGFRPGDRQLATWAIEAWQRSSANGLHVEPAAERDAVIRVYWADPAEGQYGEMQPLVIDDGKGVRRRGAAVFIRPDMNTLGPQIASRAAVDILLRDSVVYLTCVHELGHAFGLSHTTDFRDVMYFFGYGGDVGEFFGRYRTSLRVRNDIQTRSGLSPADVARLRAMYPSRM